MYHCVCAVCRIVCTAIHANKLHLAEPDRPPTNVREHISWCIGLHLVQPLQDCQARKEQRAHARHEQHQCAQAEIYNHAGCSLMHMHASQQFSSMKFTLHCRLLYTGQQEEKLTVIRHQKLPRQKPCLLGCYNVRLKALRPAAALRTAVLS